MSWEQRTVEQQREEFVLSAKNCLNFSRLCREFGISRKTGYKWLGRANNGETMNDQSRKPKHSPQRTPVAIESKILSVRQEHPAWGASKIRHILVKNKSEEERLPCIRTINNILKRNNCIDPEESAKRQATQRFEMPECNMMWQTDFKGEFKTQDGKYCYPLDIVDDCSRFCIRIRANDSTAQMVIPVFQSAFDEYGLPDAILSDNGAQFAGFRGGFTQFEKWLMNLDILPIHGRVYHPQTQGKIERFHRTMKNELLKYQQFSNATEANAALQIWRNQYNTERPHAALNMRTPAEVYTPSQRQMPSSIKPFEYGGQFHVIKVNSWGYARFAHHQVYLSETMSGEYIEFRPNKDGTAFYACYRNFIIGKFSTENGKLINRKIRRI